MKVQGVLLLREGLEHFDPLCDLIGTNNPQLFGSTATPYFTWRKHSASIPQGKNRIVGVFLRDGLDNFSYAGDIGGSWTRNYIQSIIPRLKHGYEHSPYHRLFGPPKTVEELLAKLGDINDIYFDGTTVPEHTGLWTAEPQWEASEEKGVLWVEVPREVYVDGLKQIFTDIWQSLKPSGRPWLICPLASSPH